MPKLLVCQHVAYEILGTLDPLLREAGFRIRYVNFGRDPLARPALTNYDALVILGGPMNVDEFERYPHLGTEIEMIHAAIERGMPVLGICLGAQLIAKALGADVRRNRVKEIGWYDLTVSPHGRRDPVIGHLADTEKIFQWHGDTFDIPPGAVHLAASPTCENQAFRFRHNVYGFQFHLEVDEHLIKRWLEVPVHRREIAALGGAIDPDVILADTTRYIHRSLGLSECIFASLIEIFGGRKRFVALPSR
jgi:GMP synthase (glutamine-hydrolysing)